MTIIFMFKNFKSLLRGNTQRCLYIINFFFIIIINFILLRSFEILSKNVVLLESGWGRTKSNKGNVSIFFAVKKHMDLEILANIKQTSDFDEN